MIVFSGCSGLSTNRDEKRAYIIASEVNNPPEDAIIINSSEANFSNTSKIVQVMKKAERTNENATINFTEEEYNEVRTELDPLPKKKAHSRTLHPL
jgi:hypothetical protein